MFCSLVPMLTSSVQIFPFQRNLHRFPLIYMMGKCKSFTLVHGFTWLKMDSYNFTFSRTRLDIYTYTKGMFKTIYLHAQHWI
jgi:hypothetical protein